MINYLVTRHKLEKILNTAVVNHGIKTLILAVFSILSLQYIPSYGQTHPDYAFDQITTTEGLSHNQISSFYEDDQGFLWIGTFSGLNRYDGYDFENIYNQKSQEVSLTNNTILWIAEGPNHTIWINTGEGVSIYDPSVDQFIDPEPVMTKYGVSNINVLELLIDLEDNSWFVLEEKGIIKVDHLTDERHNLNTAADSYIQLSTNDITDLCLDIDGNVWVMHRSGLVDVIDTKINRIIRKFDFSDQLVEDDYYRILVDADMDLWIHRLDDQLGLLYANTRTGEIRILDESELSSRLVRDVIQDGKQNIWVGTDHGGISIIDKKSWKITTLKYQPNNSGSLSHNSITSLYRSKNGIIWVGKAKNGVSYYNENAGKFIHYRYNDTDPSYNDMSSLAEDNSGKIWIGTNGRGLLRFDPNTKKIKKTGLLESEPSSIGSNVVVCLNYASDQSLWIGTYLRGLFRYKNEQLTHIQHMKGQNSLSENNVWSLFEDSNEDLWIGTIGSGVDKYDVKENEFINFNSSNGLTVNYVTRLLQDDQDQIWMATGQGITVHNLKTGNFRSYLSNNDIENTLSSNSVISLLFDSKRNMWVGTMRGLNLYKPEIDGFEVYTENDGMSSDIIMSILEDDDGNIWIGTSKGLSKLNFELGKPNIQTFDISDGLQGDQFNEGAALKTKDGMLVFSGQNGLNIFDPRSIVIDDKPPVLAFTAFHLNSQKILPGQMVEDQVILEKSMNETQHLTLAYDQNSFAFEFVALTYDQAFKNKYEYKLEGFDVDWVSAPSDIRMANYTNLDYGKYIFKVRASNKYNTWNYDGISMEIVINPPFWKTRIAYALYGFVLILILYLTRKAIINRERLRANIENERIQAQRMHELDLMKIKFFTNISHEFRTPISLVLTPIERMIKYPEQAKMADFQIIQRNAKRLLTLVNQLLDFRKMEANQHRLDNSSGDLVKFLRHVIESFADLSKEKNIELILDSDLKQYYTRFDKDKMDKILFNLLSNAFKFTFPGGKIIIDLEKNEMGNIVLSVTDTGIGIPKEKQEVVFDRFIQSDLRGDMINSGTGIGLSITKEFVELHHGKISVDSELDQGSTFSLEFPFKQLAEEELADGVVDVENQGNLSKTIVEFDRDKPTVFLVEDNADFRFYLKDNLKQFYNVSESFNGKEAWKLISSSHPDIVISDVMMPVMNGVDLCKKIKNDPRTSHIPVILLTAQSANEKKIEGLDAGAIEFISKPFNFEILVSTINSALKFQQRVNASNKKVVVEPSAIEIVSRDEKLVKDALKLVEENISNADFGVEELSHELGYSRGHLYQKMLKITGQTPMDFIRNIRMKRAAELLAKSQMNVSEVAYKVGYNNPKLFSRYFKTQFRMYPSEFMTKSSKN